MRHVIALTISCVFVVASASTAQAQDNSAAVEALFTEGKRLIGEGKIAEACPKFLASYNLEQRVGTLLNLADCYERNGQLATAWARYVEARPLAQRAGQNDRSEYAAQHAAALEPQLARLTVLAPTGIAGLEIKRDGVPVDPAAFGVALPIDPGAHTIVATAPGRRTWSNAITIAKEPEKKVVQVPALADVNAPVVVVPPAPAPVASTATDNATRAEEPSAPPADASPGTSGRKIAGLVIAGVGVVGIGIGAGFGISALGTKSDSDAYCGQGGRGANDCVGDGVSLRSDAVSSANVSTVFFAAGAALVVGGLVLWLTAPSSSPPASNAASFRRGLVF